MKAAFPDEEIVVVQVAGAGRHRPDDSSGVRRSRVPAAEGSGLRSRLGRKGRTHLKRLANHPAFGPGRRMVEQTRREAEGMTATEIAVESAEASPTAIDRVVGLLDAEVTGAVVAVDKTSERVAWRVAQARPDRLVLSGGETSIQILSMLDSRGLDRRPCSVQHLLAPVENHVGTYPFPELRQPGRARVVSLVSNSVEGDSRVQKVAASLADLGYESILLGRHPDDDRDRYLLGSALVIRVPVPMRSYAWEREAPPRTPLTAFAFRSRSQVIAARRHAKAQARRLSARQGAGLASPREALVEDGRRWLTGLRASLHAKNRQRFFALRGDESIETTGRWRRPMLGDLAHWALADDRELEYGPYLESLRPDVIHAHDSDTLSVAMTAADRLRAAGHQVKVVYDAHEYTPGTARFHSRQSQVLSAVERDCVPRCDAVVTVSDEIAELLVSEHGLNRRPAVVLNAPTAPSGKRSVGARQRLGLSDDTPILVYVGGVAPQRGVDLAVAALPDVPRAHLVMVAPESGRTQRLMEQARELDVSDRVHRLDYVPADEVVDFISSCDVGLIPFRPLPNSELGVPTKYREYLVAGLPVVASNQGLVAQAIQRAGTGELFETGDARELAQAINRLLPRIDHYRSAITPSLIDENLWERQVSVLRDVYVGLGAPAELVPRARHTDPPSVLIGRANVAGQGTAWAAALRRAGISAQNLQVVSSDSFGFDADVSVLLDDWLRPNYRLRAYSALVSQHTHALIEYGVPMFGQGIKPLGDVDSLARSGLTVGLLFHGSDVRRPLRHAAREPWSPFKDPRNGPLTAQLQERTSSVHRALASFEGPMFVSTPDLLDDVPFASWLPVVVDTHVFSPDGRSLSEQRRPVVAHVPSRGSLKGTPYVTPVLRRLHEQGVIEYRPLQGLPHSMMPRLIRSADIVVDQVLMNLMGVAAAEAMACGRVVIAHVDERLASRYPIEPPVVDATPDTLEQVIRDLVADRERMADLGRRGREFALAVHDGRLSAQVLAKGLGLELQPTL